MTFEFLSSYANDFARWSGLGSPDTYLRDNEYVRLNRPVISPEIARLVREQNLFNRAATDGSSTAAQGVKKIVLKIRASKPPSFLQMEPPPVVQPSLPVNPITPPPMSPVPSLRPPFSDPAFLPRPVALPPVNVTPPVAVTPLPVTPPPMSPVPSLRPPFSDPAFLPRPVALPPVNVTPPVAVTPLPVNPPPMSPVPSLRPPFSSPIIQPPTPLPPVVQPPLPISPAVPPPMSPLPPLRPPFSDPAFQPRPVTPPTIHVNPPVVEPIAVTPPPMSPVPSIQPQFPNAGVHAQPTPSPTIHANPHLQGSGSMPVPDPAPDSLPISDPLIDPQPPGGTPPNPDPASGPAASPLSKLTALLPLISKFVLPALPLIPPYLYELFTREEKILQNINVNILATRIPKRYSVAFGNKHGEEMSIDFEVVAGKFYKDEIVESKDDFAYTIFKNKTWISYIPGLKRFEWKRKVHETDCNITIDDPGNLSLQKGPVSVYYPLSENEGFNIIYRDPTATTSMTAALLGDRTHDYHLQGDSSDFEGFNVASMKVMEPLGRYEKERTQTAPLPFDDNPSNANDYYMKVTQYNPDFPE